MATLTIDPDEATSQSLARIAADRNQSPSALIQRALEQFMAHERSQEQFRLETLDAMRHHDESGLHLTGAEVDEWLVSRCG